MDRKVPVVQEETRGGEGRGRLDVGILFTLEL